MKTLSFAPYSFINIISLTIEDLPDLEHLIFASSSFCNSNNLNKNSYLEIKNCQNLVDVTFLGGAFGYTDRLVMTNLTSIKEIIMMNSAFVYTSEIILNSI